MLPNVSHSSSTAMDHIPVLASEVAELLDLQPGDTIVDGTFGAGGHAALLEPRLGERSPRDLKGQCAVIVGLGPIGRNIAALLKMLGMSVIGARRSVEGKRGGVAIFSAKSVASGGRLVGQLRFGDSALEKPAREFLGESCRVRGLG